MVFGTTTTVGVKVGRDVNQMPNVLIAYDRQEAVIMPLLANTGEKPGSQNMLTPCAPATEITTTGGKPPTTTTQKMNDEISFGTDGKATVHPCKFVGVRTGPDNFLIQDSYSVLASFGAKLKGNATDGTAAAGLAQYFATGAAAQTLALNGGAAIIAVGDAAEAAASNPSNAANAASALGAKGLIAQVKSGVSKDAAIAAGFAPLTDLLTSKIFLTDGQNLASQLAAFDQHLKNSTGYSPDLAQFCKNLNNSDCVKVVKEGDLLVAPELAGKSDQIRAAINNWKTP
jgi:hypothetical protein